MSFLPQWARVGLGVASLAALAAYLQWSGSVNRPTADSNSPEQGAGALQTPLPEPPGFIGVLVANESVTLSAGVSGPLATFRVKVGEPVSRGELLATVEVAPQKRELAIAQAKLSAALAAADRAALEHRLAQSQLERQERLSEHLSPGELEQSRYQEKLAATSRRAAGARVDEERARVEQLRQLVAQADIRAPFDGVVAQRYVDRGAWLEASSPVVRVIGSDGLKVRFALPEAEASAIAKGTPITVQLEGTAHLLQGRVSVVSPEVDLGARTVMCEALVSIPESVGAKAYAGRVVSVRFPSPRQARLQ